MVEEKDANSASPYEAGAEAVPAADPRPTDEARHEHREQNDRHEQPPDHAEATIVEQIPRRALGGRGCVAAEQPARVRVPRALQAFDETVPRLGVGAVRGA